MKRLILIPIVLVIGVLLSKRIGSIGQDIILPRVDVQERIIYHAKKWGLEVALVKAVAKVESNFNPRAKNPADPSYGLMQITPILAFDYGLIKNYKNPSDLEIELIFDINNNLSVACDFLNRLRKYPFKQQIMSYNLGETGYINGRRNYDYYNKVRGYYEAYG